MVNRGEEKVRVHMNVVPGFKWVQFSTLNYTSELILCSTIFTPDYLSSKFVDRSSVSNYSLRDTEGKLAIPQPHTNYIYIYMKNSFSYSGAVLWNSLPIELRQADSLNAFRAGCERLFSLS